MVTPALHVHVFASLLYGGVTCAFPWCGLDVGLVFVVGDGCFDDMALVPCLWFLCMAMGNGASCLSVLPCEYCVACF